MTKILHVLNRLTGAGATRAVITLCEAQKKLGMAYRHSLITLHQEAYPHAMILAKRAGIDVMRCPSADRLRQEIETADIVELNFWNTPRIYQFIESELPACRLLLSIHILGRHAPQAMTPDVVSYSDFIVASSSLTLLLPCLQEAVQSNRTATGLTAGDAGRLDHVKLLPHEGFNVGYIGTANEAKIHPAFVSMSAAVDVPGARFVVCGGDDAHLRAQARELGVESRFVFAGFVERIGSVLETLDVFGYPLCEETYATSERSLQEAMYVGLPPVVFPYGGIADLVEHDKSGLVVHTEAEYRQAIEFLYHHPAERKRLGDGARQVARARLSSDAAAVGMAAVYQRMLERPKRRRHWPEPASAAARFIAGLGEGPDSGAADFARSMAGPAPEVERRIASARTLIACDGGIFDYRNSYPDDPHLRFWTGLVLLNQAREVEAAREFEAAVRAGLPSSRVAAYLRHV